MDHHSYPLHGPVSPEKGSDVLWHQAQKGCLQGQVLKAIEEGKAEANHVLLSLTESLPQENAG